MGRSLGRARAHAVVSLLMFGALGTQPVSVLAQDEEVIVDPELAGSSGPSGSGSGSDDEVISDPELSEGKKPGGETDHGWGEVYKPAEQTEAREPSAAQAEEPDPMANTGIAKLEVAGQTAVDMHAEEDLEDFYEARLRFGGEVDFRLSRKLRLSIGTRIDFAWYAPFQNDRSLKTEQVVHDRAGRAIVDMEGNPLTRPVTRTALQEDRYEIDIIPLSAFLDATIADGVHLRIGEQVISLARMDGVSVTDMLAVADFRPQARADPAALKLAQPAVRLDWDLSSWATLQVVYVPWFMPHLTRPNRDNYVGQALTWGGSDGLSSPALSGLIDPSYQTKATEAALRFVGPAPDFRNPQAEARLNFRGSTFELAVLGGTALEKLPSIYYSPVIETLLKGPGETAPEMSAYTTEAQRAALLQMQGNTLIDVEYHRYYLVGVDGSFDIAPLQVGFELSYSPSRHLYTADATGRSLPLPDVSRQILDPDDAAWNDPSQLGRIATAGDRSIRKGVQMVQAALHVEYLRGESLLIAAEGYLFQALELPHAKTRQWLGFPRDKGTYLAGLVAASYDIQEGKYHFDLSALMMMGPSFIITPQVEFRLVDGLYLNIGAQIYEGPTPNNLTSGVQRTATNITPGGAFSGYDNVYLGFRWVP